MDKEAKREKAKMNAYEWLVRSKNKIEWRMLIPPLPEVEK